MYILFKTRMYYIQIHLCTYCIYSIYLSTYLKFYIIIYFIYIWSLFSHCFIFTNPIFPGTLEQKAL